MFDNDGTLWCEKPMPIQLDFILRRLVEMAEADADVARTPAVEGRLRARLRLVRRASWTSTTRATTPTSRIVGAAASSRRTTASASRTSRRVRTSSCAARSIRRSAAATSSAPTRRWSNCCGYLEANGFTNYIVSGGGRDFMRPISQECTAFRASASSAARRRSSTPATSAAARSRTRPRPTTSTTAPRSRSGSGAAPAGGRCWRRATPTATSRCCDFTQHADKPFLRLLVLHDDAEREFAYTTGAEQALERAAGDGWTVVSMKDDWATVFTA